MLDRQALVDALMGGLVGTADTLAAPDDPLYALVEQRGFSRYPYDLSRAQVLLAEAGWVRSPGGSYASSTGEPLALDITFSDSPANTTEAQAVAGQWKAGGVAEVTLSPVSASAPTAIQNELRANFKSVQAYPRAADLVQLGSFTTAEISSADNRYSGGNRGGYSNPIYDRLYDRASVTLDEGQRQGLMADMLKILADDVATVVAFYDSSNATTAFRRGVRGPGQVSGLQLVTTWNIHEWEID